MKFAPFYKSLLDCSNSDDVFHYLKSTLNDSITYWDYFVNWQKVLSNVKDLEIDLNTLNYLVGKENVEEEFYNLLVQRPSIVRLIPILLASRDQDFKILTDFDGGELKYETFSFRLKPSFTQDDLRKACVFAKESGLLNLFRNKTLKSVPDYVLGVETGLDSNGRKNRGGTAMENILENLLTTICIKYDIPFMKQATADKVRAKWGIKVSVDKSSRRFDFGVKCDSTLYLIETNYYGGGGSKLKATAGEYKSLYDFLSKQGHGFIWITDGLGWLSTLKPLEETFYHIDHTLNLKMVTSGVLEYILVNKL